jgi:hypothetical protein
VWPLRGDALARSGRQRGPDAEAARIQTILRRDYLHQLPLVEDAFAAKPSPCCASSTPPAATPKDMATATTALFHTHPDAPIISSQPGLGELTSARVLAEPGPAASPNASCTGGSITSGWPPPGGVFPILLTHRFRLPGR